MQRLSPTEIRTRLAKIVGDRYVSIDPSTLAIYSWNTGIGIIPGNDKFHHAWPIAVVEPGSTEEVAAIVRCCVEWGIPFKAHSTGYGSMSNVLTDKSITIDLRRMDFIEIDEENRMAIIGPYTTANRLQAEAFKRGLTCHIVGAGSVHSPLASATSVMGIGITGHFTSMNLRNLLSWEWVTPSGEIVTGGSAGVGAGWFSSDGPGPGVRGMLRGFFGAMGAYGVFTRIGIKLYPTPFKGIPTDTGRYPQIGMQLPENFYLHHIVWDNAEDQRRGTYEILESDIALAVLRMPPDHIGWTITGTNTEYLDKLRSGDLPDVARVETRFNWTLINASYTAEEAAWREGVLKNIVERTAGRFLRLEKEHEEVLFRNLMTSHYIPRVFRPSGGIATTFGALDSFSFLPVAYEAAEEVISHESFAEDGHLVRGGPEEHWIWTNEGKYMWAENILEFDTEDHESKAAAWEAMFHHFAYQFKKPVGIMALQMGPILDLLGDSIGRPQDVIRSFKKKLDPNHLAQTGEYVDPDTPKLVQAIMPKVRPLIFSRIGRRVLARRIAKNGLY